MSFATLLVANRGEIARRIFRSAHDMGIRCVAVYVDADADAPFVGEADEAVRLERGYLDAASVLEAAASRYHGAAPGEIDWSAPRLNTRAGRERLLRDFNPCSSHARLSGVNRNHLAATVRMSWRTGKLSFFLSN